MRNVFSLLPLIVCRFILHLRQTKQVGTGSLRVPGYQSHSIQFVEPVGSSLQVGEGDEEDVDFMAYRTSVA